MSEQEARGGKILPAFFVEPIEKYATFERGEWPSHMTYFPPVSAELTAAHIAKLKQYVNPMKPFMATIGEDTELGPSRDIPANFVVPSKELLAVHRRIFAVFQHLPHPKEFMPYNPHITKVKGGPELEAGDSIEVGGFSVVARPANSDTWMVMAKVGLRGADMTTDARIIKRSERTE